MKPGVVQSNNVQTLDEMQLYYKGLGYDFEAELLDDNVNTDGCPLPAYPDVDSERPSGGDIVMSPGLSEERHKALLAEFEANRQIIDDIAAQEVDRGWFGDWFDEPGEKEKLRLVTLMALNYSIYEEIQGRKAIKPCDEGLLEAEKDTVGGLVGVMFAEVIDDG